MPNNSVAAHPDDDEITSHDPELSYKGPAPEGGEVALCRDRGQFKFRTEIPTLRAKNETSYGTDLEVLEVLAWLAGVSGS